MTTLTEGEGAPDISRRHLLAALSGAALAALPGPDEAKAAAAPFRLIASGLQFPESPLPMRDGSVLCVEIARGTLSRVAADGTVTVVATPGGGPNGAAIGPDGHCYVANNGGFAWRHTDTGWLPAGIAPDYAGGRIERIDLGTGRVEVLYREVNGHPLSAPNDLVFDDAGGFWFTDYGQDRPRSQDHGGIYYAKADGSAIHEVIYPVNEANGIALSADGQTLLVATTSPRIVFAYEITAPGQIRRAAGLFPGRVLAGLGGTNFLDSMALDDQGNMHIATVLHGGVVSLTPAGRVIRHLELPDVLTTSIRFGGPDRRTAFITLGTTGRLISVPWATAGLAPRHVA